MNAAGPAGERAARAAGVVGLVIAGVVPLVTVGLRVDFPGELTGWFPTTSTTVDAFNAGKAVWLTCGVLTAGLPVLGWTLVASRGRTLTARALVPALAALVWSVALAAVIHRDALARVGFLEHFEGWPVLLSYFALFFLGAAAVSGATRGASRFGARAVRALVASSSALLVVGAFQYAGHSPWDWPSLESVAAALVPDAIGAVDVASGWRAGTFSSTLYNPNWAGTFFAGTTAASFVWAVAARGRQVPWAWVWSLGCAFGLAASGFRVGLFACVAAQSLVLAVSPLLRRRTGRACVLLAAHVAIALVVPTHRGESVGGELSSVAVGLPDAAREVWKRATGRASAAAPRGKLEAFEPQGAALRFVWRGHEVLWFEDAPHRPRVLLGPSGSSLTLIPVPDVADTFRVAHPKLWDVTVARTAFAGRHGYAFGFGFASPVDVYFLPDGPRVAFAGEFHEIRSVRAFRGPLADEALSRRGYLWNRSLPLLVDSPWFGVGPGHFPRAFPQVDPMGKFNAAIRQNRLAEKPHNAYLQAALQTGLPGLFLYLAVLALAFARAVRLERAEPDAARLALFAFACGVSVAFLGADSHLGTSPFLWLALGALTGWPAPDGFSPRRAGTRTTACPSVRAAAPGAPSAG